MSQIANNKLLKRVKAEKIEKDFLNGDYKQFLKVEQSSGGLGPRKYVPVYDKKKFDLVWEKLNPMSREIILFCAKYDTLLENNTKHLPDAEIIYLIEKYKVTKPALRKAKERALDALLNCKL